ncbi:MAG TPA: XTP/dITP diphosphatase, partial [Desulfobacterales bacterium]|nr:XTP/dITP diphosphatase [Desulfobacterales bacterium]
MVSKKPVLVIATRNRGKTAEIRDLLQGFPMEVRDLSDFGPIPEVEEDGQTFDENAYKKSSFTARVLGYPALADDSGLAVAALNGAPGVLSARFGGEGLSDADRCRKLLAEMKGRSDRRAAFECVLSLAVPSGPALTYEGRCEGLLTEAPAGANGFGYDPIFFYPPSGKTFAQLTREEKNRISHRGKALQELRAEFEKVILWIRRHMPPGRRSL